MINTLEQMLNLFSARHALLARNVAHANTWGYKAQDVPVFEVLRQAYQTGQASARVEEDTVTPARIDGNNVDLERELAHLTENSLLYETTLRVLNNRLAGLKLALRGG
jgi:flagellar basal-body rod protein FlgB